MLTCVAPAALTDHRPVLSRATCSSRIAQRLGVGRRVLLATLMFLAAGCGGDGSTAPTATVRTLTVIGSTVAEAGAYGYQFVAMATHSNGTPEDVSMSATWTTSDGQIAYFTTLGGRPMLTTLKRGVVVITAAYGGKTATITVSVL